MNNDYYSKYWLPINISTHGDTIDSLITVLHYFMAVLFVGWFIYLVYVLIRFRESANPKAQLDVKHFKLPTYLEVGIVLVEAALLVFVSQPLWAKVKNEFPAEADALVVRVVAEQFAWNTHYPGRDGKFGETRIDLIDTTNPVGLDRESQYGLDDIVTINSFHVPVNKPVIVHLSSKDVIHSFALPVARVKQDAIPGMTIPVWFEVTQTGEFEVACAQLCGNGHYRMRGAFIVDSAEDFEAFIQEEYEYLAEDMEEGFLEKVSGKSTSSADETSAEEQPVEQEQTAEPVEENSEDTSEAADQEKEE